MHGAAGFEAVAPADDPVFGAGGGGLAAVSALTCALIEAGGVRDDGDWIRDSTDMLLQVNINTSYCSGWNLALKPRAERGNWGVGVELDSYIAACKHVLELDPARVVQ